MGSTADDWLHAHAHGMLWAIEVMWVAGFLMVFVVYFLVKRQVNKKKRENSKPEEPLE